LPMS